MAVEAGPLHGPRVLLRRGTAEDVPALLAVRAEPEVRRWWRTPPPAEELLAELRGEDDAVPYVVLVDGAVVGLVQYAEEADPEYRHASIDLFLSARVHGRGIGPEVVAVLAQHLVEVRGHHRITIDPAADNAAAIRAYTKVGFTPVGRLRRYERGEDGTWHDGLLMDLLADELVLPWSAGPGWVVWRQDEHGNRAEVARHPGRADAERHAADLEARGHKQLYWVTPLDG